MSVDLIRAGSTGDGGYLIPDDLQDVDCCFSPGVDVTAGFEKWLAENYQIKSFMADASVDGPPFENEFFDFEKKYLGAIDNEDFLTLTSWMKNKLDGQRAQNAILQMDIESAEYDVLAETTIDVLQQFRIMVIEFHDLEKILQRRSLPLIRAIFDKIHSVFSIAHVHPNNLCGIASKHGIQVPRTFEVTYIRNDRVPKLANGLRFNLPHALDTRNVPDLDDIVMPEIWWR